MNLTTIATISSDLFVGVGGGSIAGYAAGRVTKMAVQVVKWIAAAFIGIELMLDQLGVITIHYGRATEVLNNMIGITGIQELGTALTNFIFSWVPMASGFGVGFYAGYKKMVV